MRKKRSLLLDPYSEFIVLVGTNRYAGNFAREMCAFCTGVIGDCEVGKEYAERFRQEVSERINEAFDDIVQQVADDNGCLRPCAMWDLDNSRVAIFFFSRPTDAMLSLMRERAVRFAEEFTREKNLHITSFKLIRKDVTHVEEPLLDSRKQKRK